MIFQEFQLSYYCNYEELVVIFVLGINVLIGENVQGKINLLEVIYLLVFIKSYWMVKDWELIGWY